MPSKLCFQKVSEITVVKIVDRMTPKTSKGRDGIINVLLK